MKFSGMSMSLSLLFFSFLFSTAFCANPLFHYCFSQENYTADSPYNMNLNALTRLLYAKAPPTGFWLSTVGQGPDHVNGLTLCRGDVSMSDCRACVDNASKEIKNRCPSSKGAIIWYDNCLLKYSNEDFFGAIDERNRFYMYNVRDVEDPASFNEQTRALLGKLAGEAYDSPRLYATGEEELKGEASAKKLYGLVQCTRDLSKADCKKCLDSAIGELGSCCNGKEGGRVVGGSCNFRYEIYPFVNAS